MLRIRSDGVPGVRSSDLIPPEHHAFEQQEPKELAETGQCTPRPKEMSTAASPVSGSGELPVGVAAVASELDRDHTNLQILTGRILKLFDDERRSIARELHDTTAQNLAALSMNLTILSSALGDKQRTIDILAECNTLTKECLKGVRSLSYLLHPPLLDELGLMSALQSFIELYQRETNVHVELRAGSCPRFTPALELAAFRVAQEALFNVHRHSGDQRATVTIDFTGESLDVAVRDWGKGIHPDAVLQNTIGIAGMRERISALGGSLKLQPAAPGTLVRARFPLQQS
jgi:signal transduction histidine kinase